MAELYVIGIGPGDAQTLTQRARAALEKADLICGYTLYVELLRPLYPEKEFFSTGMTGEIERCRACLKRAQEGRTVALVCSGDAGVYGMAGPVLALAPLSFATSASATFLVYKLSASTLTNPKSFATILRYSITV